MADKATRQAFGEALVAAGESHPDVVVLEADLGKSTKSELFGKRYPYRYFEMGIAEQNMIGAAAGMATCGKTAFCCSFACFVVGRFETIKISVAYNQANVKIVGTHAGIGIGEDGYSQMGLEDVGLLRTLPGMEIFQPADDLETAQVVEHLCRSKKPSYLRLTRQALRRVHQKEYIFRPGELDPLREEGEVVVFATGGVVMHALDAAQALADSHRVQVVNVPTLKPLTADKFTPYMNASLWMTVEDHTVIGGLGSAVSEVSAEARGPRVVRHGVHDVFGESGSPEGLYEKYRLDGKGIAAVLRGALSGALPE